MWQILVTWWRSYLTRDWRSAPVGQPVLVDRDGIPVYRDRST